MIIGETFKSDYDSYGEENYDYLFKRKPSPARQQKKTEKKEKKFAKKQGRQVKRQDKKAGIIPKKRLIQGNFGMFNKNKRKEEAAKAAAELPDNSEAENTSLPTEEPIPTPEATTPVENTDAGESANENAETPVVPSDESNSSESEYDEYDEYGYDDSSFDEPADKSKSETKNESKESKSKGFGAAIGFVFLGITIGLTAYALLSSDKKSKELIPFKHAA
ncbi:MAG: hypothetical protein HY062_14895 [Bacteroidetes bacterium]|nr:hypothetical protein [Bacteroidota bacterium]